MMSIWSEYKQYLAIQDDHAFGAPNLENCGSLSEATTRWNNNVTNIENSSITISDALETSWFFPSSQRHTLPKQENVHSISEVIILNNDQHQHKKSNINKQQD